MRNKVFSLFNKNYTMQHSVIFSMNENIDALRTKEFIIEAKKLSTISGVLNFKAWKQVSKKNNFQYGLSMEFKSEEDFQIYNNHPIHKDFIDQQWIPCVSDFLEIDLESL
jgi:Stress responsive A/B Barrel Domain